MAGPPDISDDFAEAVSADLVESGHRRLTPGDRLRLVAEEWVFQQASADERDRVRQAADLVRGWRPPMRMRTETDRSEGELQLLAARADAVSAWVHRFASENFYVRHWRERWLPSGLLEPHEVAGWVQQQIDRDGSLSLEWAEWTEDGWTPHRDNVADHNLMVAGLCELAARLSQAYSWSPAEATTFALTGQEIFCFPIRGRWVDRPGTSLWGSVSHDVTSRVTITIDPRVSPEDLARWWRRARDGHQTLSSPDGRWPRTPGQRVSALARFMASRWWPPEHPNGSTWAEDHRAWNAAHRDDGWAYSNLGAFRSESLRAMRQVGVYGG
jgi:hypothetical protein